MINKQILVGYLGKDPELKELPSGAKYCRFSVATSESWKDKRGEWQNETTWHNIIGWNGQAEAMAKVLKKGMMVYIEGKTSNRTYKADNDAMKSFTEVVAQSWLKLEKSGNAMHEPTEPPTLTHNESEDEGDDDLPF